MYLVPEAYGASVVNNVENSDQEIPRQKLTHWPPGDFNKSFDK